MARGVTTEERTGRPMRASEHSTKLVGCRLTDEERGNLQTNVKAMGSNVSSKIRELLEREGLLKAPRASKRKAG